MVLKIALFEALNLDNNTRIIRLLRTSPNVPQGVADAPVAQLDRVAGSDPVGRGFDSLLARHLNQAFNFFPQTSFSQSGFPLGFSLAKPPADISDTKELSSRCLEVEYPAYIAEG